MKKTIIFDLDGTLVDSIEDIAQSMNLVLKKNGFDTFSVERYNYFVGGGVDVLVKNVKKALGVSCHEEKLLKEFKQAYEGKTQTHTKPYEGIQQLLEKLQNHNLAVLSNKPHEATKLYVEKFFPNTFSMIFGQRKGAPKKPNPQTAIEIANHFKVPCEEVFFVGDTDVDMKTAKNANMKSIGVLWGFRDEKELSENRADFIVKKPSEILKIVDKN